MLQIHKVVPSSLMSEEGFDSLKNELDGSGMKFVIVKLSKYMPGVYNPVETYEIQQHSGLMPKDWVEKFQVGEPMLYSEAVALIRILEGGNYE